jgi:hypothetical protein
MSHQLKQTWEKYVSTWKIESPADKKASFEQCLDTACQYTDPLAKTKGWDAFTEYMLNFHQQFPGNVFCNHLFHGA